MNRQSVPDDLVALSAQISETQDEGEKPASELTGLFARMCNLLASGRVPGDFDISELLSAAFKLDDELQDWAANLPTAYQFSLATPEPSAKTYSETCHAYSSIFTAEVWVLYRTARFVTNGLIASLSGASAALESGSATPELESTAGSETPIATPKLQQSFEVIDSLRTDMCDAIPYLMDRHGSQPRSTVDLPLSSRTPVLNYLIFISKTEGLSERMASWTQNTMAELHANPPDDIDSGAIWMNHPAAVEVY